MRTPSAETELRIVKNARAQSLKEATELDEMKRAMRLNYLSQKLGTESQFEQRWPQLCAERLRQLANQDRKKKAAGQR